MAPYPTKDEVAKLVSHLSSDNFQPFYDRVDPNVTWDVLGRQPARAPYSRRLLTHSSQARPMHLGTSLPLVNIVPVRGLGTGADQLPEAWKKGALETAGNVLTRPLKFKPVNVVGGGDQAWAVAELEALDAVGKDGISRPE